MRNIFVEKIAELLLAITKNPFEGVGKPEALRGDLKGYWSRGISEEHRIVLQLANIKSL